MRVLHVVADGSWGGAQRHVRDLLAELPGTDGRLVVGSEGTLTTWARTAGIEVHVIQGLARGASPHLIPRARHALCRLLSAAVPDVVHAHGIKAAVVVAGTPGTFVYTSHGTAVLDPTRSVVQRSALMVLERTMIPRIAAYIGVSHAECEFAARLGISNEQIHLIPNGVRVNALVSKVRGQVTEIGFIGRLIPEKGADRLPDLARRLSGGVTLHVAGDGLLRHTLEGLANVVLHGWVEDGISEFLAGLQVLVLPSRKEGLPYALLEAMERAVPAVAMGVGGLRDVISDRVDGRLVPEGDLPAMSGALAELIDNPDEATSMGRAARATVEQRYTLSKMVERTQAVYASAIKGAGAAWKA